jgi:hypothetical protein
MLFLDSLFPTHAAYGYLPVINKLAGSGKAADYEWQAVSDGVLSI